MIAAAEPVKIAAKRSARMDEILRCRDIFGRSVVLTEHRWVTHILVDHSEMRNNLAMVEEALTDPHVVNYDSDFEHRESYYLLAVAGSSGTRHVKVCVEYRESEEEAGYIGHVITAYVTRSLKSNEVLKWTRDS